MMSAVSFHQIQNKEVKMKKILLLLIILLFGCENPTNGIILEEEIIEEPELEESILIKEYFDVSTEINGLDVFLDLQNKIDSLFNSGGGTLYLEEGIYSGQITLKNNVDIIGKGTDNTFIHFINDGIGSAVNDNSGSVKSTVKDLTILRSGTGELIINAEQENRYGLHIISLETELEMHNVRIASSGFNIGDDRQTDYAGIISIVNESGSIIANNCKIMTKGRGIYHPENGAYQITEWSGNIYTEHKAISIHEGIIAGDGELYINIDYNSYSSGVSTYAGEVIWNGELYYNGPAEAIWNGTRATIIFYGYLYSSKVGIINSGIGETFFTGNINTKGVTCLNLSGGKSSVWVNGTKY